MTDGLHQLRYEAGGTPTIDGHPLHAYSMTVGADATDLPTVTFELPVHPLITGGFKVHLTRTTRDALIALGWSPPIGDAQETEHPRAMVGQFPADEIEPTL